MLSRGNYFVNALTLAAPLLIRSRPGIVADIWHARCRICLVCSHHDNQGRQAVLGGPHTVIRHKLDKPLTKPDVKIIWKDLLRAVYWFDESLQLHHRNAGFPEMSRTKSLILLTMADGLERPIQIAERIGITRQAVHLALKELERDGLISMEQDPNDSRAKRVFFSEEDQRDEMRKFARHSLYRIEDILAKRVGKKNFDTFRAVLQADWGDVVAPDTRD